MWMRGRSESRKRGARGRRLAYVGILAALGAVGLLAKVGLAGEAGAVPGKVGIAVIPFIGSAEKLPEGFGMAPRQAVHHALQQVRSARPVDSAAISDAAGRLTLSLSDALEDDALIRLARELQVRALIAGTFAADGDTVTIQARMADATGEGRVIRDEPIAGPAGEFLAASHRLLQRALREVGAPLTELDERRLTAAFAAGTGSLDAYVLYARAAWDQGLGTKEAHDRAIALLAKGLDADQNFAQAHVALGKSLYATNNRWKASGEFRKALQLNPRLADAHRLLGDMLVTSPRRLYDQAIQSYQAALEVWPDYAEARVGLGDARQAKGQFDEAIGEYRKALAIEPANARVYLGLGKIYYNEKQLYHEAVAAYQQAIALDPKLLDAHLSLAELYDEKGLYDEAVARYNQALSLEPRHPGATYGLALAYEKVDVKRAIEQWERYIRLASDLPSEKDWVDIAKKHLQKLQRGEKPN